MENLKQVYQRRFDNEIVFHNIFGQQAFIYAEKI